MNNVEFTFEWYGNMVEMLMDNGYKTRFFNSIKLEAGEVVLRHDVDWSPRKAVRMAQIEADRGAQSTFFFLASSPFYNVMNREVRKSIKKINDLGHKIGLHFSTHQYFVNNPERPDTGPEPPTEQLMTCIQSEISVLEQTGDFEVNIVSFHNPPEWVLRKSFPGFTSTYEAQFFDNIEYYADSNQRWRDDPPFQGKLPDSIQVLTHPVLWGSRDAWSVDRLREERDYLVAVIQEHLQATDRTWDGKYGGVL